MKTSGVLVSAKVSQGRVGNVIVTNHISEDELVSSDVATNYHISVGIDKVKVKEISAHGKVLEKFGDCEVSGDFRLTLKLTLEKTDLLLAIHMDLSQPPVCSYSLVFPNINQVLYFLFCNEIKRLFVEWEVETFSLVENLPPGEVFICANHETQRPQKRKINRIMFLQK